MATDPASTSEDRARMRTALAGLAARQGRLDAVVLAVVRLGFAVVGWRLRASGLDLLPRDERGRVVPCVVAVAPHRGWIDPFLLLLAWPGDAPRLAWFGDERAMLRSWWRRRLLPRLGMIPISPETTRGALREHIADARMVLGRGCCLVVFPEKGPPSAAGRLRTIAPGAAWLAAAGRGPARPGRRRRLPRDGARDALPSPGPRAPARADAPAGFGRRHAGGPGGNGPAGCRARAGGRQPGRMERADQRRALHARPASSLSLNGPGGGSWPGTCDGRPCDAPGRAARPGLVGKPGRSYPCRPGNRIA